SIWISWTYDATVFTGITAMWRAASYATPPQCAPPMFDGVTSVPCKLGGVNAPSLRSGRICSRHDSLSAGVAPNTLSIEQLSRPSGGRTVLNGCVGDARSVRGVDAGKAR